MKILALLILCRIGLCLAQGRIVGGNDALMSDFPFQVSLRNLHFGWSHFCGGSILNEQWILTASHCLDGLGPAMYQVTYLAVSDQYHKYVYSGCRRRGQYS